MEAVQKAKSEGDALRAQTALPSRGSIPSTTPSRQTWALDFNQYSSESTYDNYIPVYGNAEPHLMDDHYARNLHAPIWYLYCP